MKNKRLAIILLLFIAVSITGIYSTNFFTTQTSGDHRHITDLKSAYHADAEIAQALDHLKKNQEKAEVISHITPVQRHIALTFDGLTDRARVQQLLDLLKKHHMKATFFVDGMQTAEDPQTVVNINNEGQRIENYTLLGMIHMEKLPANRLVTDFSRAQRILKVTIGQEPNLLKCNATEYTEQVLQAARASGFRGVVKSSRFVPVKQLTSASAADSFVSSLQPGSIISIKLKPNAELIANEQERTDLRPAIDKQPGLKVLQQPDLLENEFIPAVERLFIALTKAQYTTVYIDNSPKNSFVQKPSRTITTTDAVDNPPPGLPAKLAVFLQQIPALLSFPTAYAAEPATTPSQELKTIATTEPTLSYTFGGLSNPTVVNDILQRLQRLGITATFFVMEIEMQKYPQTLRRIIENGHEIGIGIRPKDGESLEETRQSIIRSRKLLQERFGVVTNLVKQPWSLVTDETKTAVAMEGCYLIGQSLNVVQSKHKDYSSADQVMAEIFGKSVFSLARGQIIHFRMDFYTNNRLVGDLLEVIKHRKIDNIAYVTSFDNPANNPANDSQYMIKPVGKLLNNRQYRYQYPVNLSQVPAHLLVDTTSKPMEKHKLLNEASHRYIGHPDVTYEDRILGFSKMEARRLDTSGIIHTDDNAIFFTFDDWGTDAAINKILYVLRKHNAQATFFVITNNVLNNPNLLRSIAMEGHVIGSHSDLHRPMAVRDPQTGRQVQTQNKAEFRQDLVTAFQKLQTTTGDVVVNGKPALSRLFRPATLAISKMGFEALLETGYEYIINGSCSTYDYKAENVSQLVRTMKDGIYTANGELKKGAVLVMHMGDNSVYTAMALDILLTANAAKADSDPSKFKAGRLDDYLPDGYSQMDRQNSLRLNSQT